MDRRGFTLIEVLLATVVLGIILMSVSRFTGQFLHTVSTSTARTVASEVASEQIERITTDPSYATLAARWAGTQTSFPNYPSMVRTTTVQRITGNTPPRDYTVVTVRVTEPTMGAPVNVTSVVARQ